MIAQDDVANKDIDWKGGAKRGKAVCTRQHQEKNFSRAPRPRRLLDTDYLTHAFRKEKNRATAATTNWALIGKLFPLIGKKIAQETAQSCSAALLKQAATAGWIPSF